MRSGKIIEVNKLEGSGIIVDDNEQEIQFCLNALSRWAQIDDLVFFDIELSNYGLMAVNVSFIHLAPLN